MTRSSPPFFCHCDNQMTQRTTLYDTHVSMNARMVDFAGWAMPLHYGSQVDEHHHVRRAAGMFDVSHMTIVDIKGAQVGTYLRLLLANDVARLKTSGKALYSCMLNATGGVIDDLIAYYIDPSYYRLVVNAATRDKDLEWLRSTAGEFDDLEITARDDLAMIAVQGPDARTKVFAALGEGMRAIAEPLAPFHAAAIGEMLIARTGYTGEDGFEIMLPASAAPYTWQMLAEAGVAPCGLGARDTLRLEAGMNLYGADMDEAVTPLESGLAWTVAWDPPEREFIGRAALEAQKAAGVERKLAGLVLSSSGVLRAHHKVSFEGHGEGEITSGGFSPTLDASIALARVPVGVRAGDLGVVKIRGRSAEVRVSKYPFVRKGKSMLG